MYSRPSVFLDHPNRQRVAQPAAAPPQANHHTRLHDKQREFMTYNKILTEADGFRQLMYGFGEKLEVLDGGSEAIAKVVEHWQNVFRVTHLALASLESQKVPTSTDPNAEAIIPPSAMPDRLVRIPTEGQDGDTES